MPEENLSCKQDSLQNKGMRPEASLENNDLSPQLLAEIMGNFHCSDSATNQAGLIPANATARDEWLTASTSPADDDSKLKPGVKQTTFSKSNAKREGMETKKKTCLKTRSLERISNVLSPTRQQRIASTGNINIKIITERTGLRNGSISSRSRDYLNPSTYQVSFNKNNNSLSEKPSAHRDSQDTNLGSSPAVNISLAELIITDTDKPVTCFSALAKLFKRNPSEEPMTASTRVEIDSDVRVALTQSSQHVFCSTLNSEHCEVSEMQYIQKMSYPLQDNVALGSAYSISSTSEEKEEALLGDTSGMLSEVTTKKANAQQEGGNPELSLTTAPNVLYLRLEHLSSKRQLKTLVFEKGSALSDELNNRNYYIESHIIFMHRNANANESCGTYREKLALDLDDEITFKNVNSRMMRHSMLYVFINLTNGKGDTAPMGSVVVDCSYYRPGKENTFLIPMTRY